MKQKEMLYKVGNLFYFSSRFQIGNGTEHRHCYIFIMVYKIYSSKTCCKTLNLSGNVINLIKMFTEICECPNLARFLSNSFLLKMLFLLQSNYNGIDLGNPDNVNLFYRHNTFGLEIFM